MLIAADDLSFFHFSTEGVPPGGRIGHYVELFRAKLVVFDAQGVDSQLRCDVRWRAFPGRLTVLRVASSPVRTAWRRLASDDRLALAVFGGGSGHVSQLGREVDVARGGAVVMSGSDPVSIVRTDDTYLSVPRWALAPLVADPDRALMSVLPAGCEALGMLSGYADLVTRTPRAMSPELGRVAETYVCDLPALAIGATRDGAELAKRRGLRAARLRALRADIERNLASDVRSAALAARHGVSPRYVHKLFEGEGTTLSRYVLGKRLERVHRMLIAPCRAASPIASLAYEAGFSDLSTFNREFRRRYGATPSDVRAAAREGGP